MHDLNDLGSHLIPFDLTNMFLGWQLTLQTLSDLGSQLTLCGNDLGLKLTLIDLDDLGSQFNLRHLNNLGSQLTV